MIKTCAFLPDGTLQRHVYIEVYVCADCRDVTLFTDTLFATIRGVQKDLEQLRAAPRIPEWLCESKA